MQEFILGHPGIVRPVAREEVREDNATWSIAYNDKILALHILLAGWPVVVI
jgi:hypothetical protein